MSALRIVTLSLLTASMLVVQGLESVETSTSSSCSGEEMQQVENRIAAIRESMESTADSNSKAASVPSSCKAALTFDSIETEDTCASDCIKWIEDVVDTPTCGDEEMLTYQRRMAAYLTQCNERKHVRLQETEGTNLEHSSRLRGLAAAQPERKLGVRGLMDALLVVTLNNAL